MCRWRCGEPIIGECELHDFLESNLVITSKFFSTHTFGLIIPLCCPYCVGILIQECFFAVVIVVAKKKKSKSNLEANQKMVE